MDRIDHNSIKLGSLPSNLSSFHPLLCLGSRLLHLVLRPAAHADNATGAERRGGGVAAAMHSVNAERSRMVRRQQRFPDGLSVTPNTPGWVELMTRREKQLRRLTILDQRWDGFQDWAQSALVVPNYTRLGFELRETPASVHEKLQEQLVKGLARARWETYGANVKPLLWPQPKFIDLGRVWQDVLHELQPLHEEWGGVKLVPIVAYGLRIYQNGSTLLMHHDKARRVTAV